MQGRPTTPEPSVLPNLLDEDRLSDPRWDNLPPVERVADRLTDLLVGADEILAFLNRSQATSLRWIEPEIRQVYDTVDQLMRKVTD